MKTDRNLWGEGLQGRGIPTHVCPAPLPSWRTLTLPLTQEVASARNACLRGQTDPRRELFRGVRHF